MAHPNGPRPGPAPPRAQERRLPIALALALALQGIAGVLHLILAPEHLASALGTGLFFLGYGSVQVAATFLGLRQSPATTALGTAVSMTGVGLWFLTSWWQDPFTGTVESVDVLGAFTTAAELGAAVLFVASMMAPAGVRKMAAAAAAIGLVAGPGIYGLGFGLAAVFTGLSDPQVHDHSEHEHAHAGAAEATSLGRVPSAAAQAIDSLDNALRKCSLAVAGLHPKACASARVDALLPDSK